MDKILGTAKINEELTVNPKCIRAKCIFGFADRFSSAPFRFSPFLEFWGIPYPMAGAFLSKVTRFLEYFCVFTGRNPMMSLSEYFT
jgi:hypothetical protein